MEGIKLVGKSFRVGVKFEESLNIVGLFVGGYKSIKTIECLGFL